MKKITIILITCLIACLVSCTKPEGEMVKHDCDKVCVLSDKYTKDSVYIRTDTLTKIDWLCDSELAKTKAVVQDWWFQYCEEPMNIEHWRYVYGNNKTNPTLFK